MKSRPIVAKAMRYYKHRSKPLFLFVKSIS